MQHWTFVGSHALQVEIMRYRISVDIDGPNFDPIKFDASLSPGCKGEIRHRRSIKLNQENQWTYWASPSIMSIDPNSTSIELLTSLSDSLVAAISETTRVALVIEQLVSDDEGISGGVYISTELVKLAAKVNASVDLPVHPDMAIRNQSDLKP